LKVTSLLLLSVARGKPLVASRNVLNRALRNSLQVRGNQLHGTLPKLQESICNASDSLRKCQYEWVWSKESPQLCVVIERGLAYVLGHLGYAELKPVALLVVADKEHEEKWHTHKFLLIRFYFHKGLEVACLTSLGSVPLHLYNVAGFVQSQECV
jgi:hypothetical protein